MFTEWAMEYDHRLNVKSSYTTLRVHTASAADTLLFNGASKAKDHLDIEYVGEIHEHLFCVICLI